MPKAYEKPYIVQCDLHLVKPLLAAIPDPTFTPGKTKNEDPEMGGQSSIRQKLVFERWGEDGEVTIMAKSLNQLLFQWYPWAPVKKAVFHKVHGFNLDVPWTGLTQHDFPRIVSDRGIRTGGGISRHETVEPHKGHMIPARFMLWESHVPFEMFEQSFSYAAENGVLCLGLARSSQGYGEVRCSQITRLDPSGETK